MSQVATAAFAFKDALYQAARTLFAADTQVLVAYGHPGLETNDDMVIFLDLDSEQQVATMGTNRGRDELLTVQVFVSSHRAGEEDNDRIPTARVYALLGILENHVRTTDTTLGGVVRECFLTSHQSSGSTDPQVLAGGRMVDCVATFTAKVRITN